MRIRAPRSNAMSDLVLILGDQLSPNLSSLKAAPDALRHYAFRLGETVDAGGRRYLDLAVIPRRAGLVAGRVRVVRPETYFYELPMSLAAHEDTAGDRRVQAVRQAILEAHSLG